MNYELGIHRVDRNKTPDTGFYLQSVVYSRGSVAEYVLYFKCFIVCTVMRVSENKPTFLEFIFIFWDFH